MAAIRFIEYDEVDSTNEAAKRLVRDNVAASGSEHGAAIRESGGAGQKGPTPSMSELYGTVIVAKRQTAGKGRRGKSFVSPGGGSIYMSLILPPLENPAEQHITILAGVAVCEAIEKSTAYKPGIKGINDIIVEGRKVCGILAEGIPDAVILGIGVNINLEEKDFPEELRETAGALRLGKDERDRFFDALVETVFRYTASS